LSCALSNLSSAVSTTLHSLSYESVRGEQVDKKIAFFFKEVLEPIYGSQEKALRKIREGEDRICLLATESTGNPVGVLQYKTELSNEFADLGIQNSLELKTLFVINAQENSGKGTVPSSKCPCDRKSSQTRFNRIFSKKRIPNHREISRSLPKWRCGISFGFVYL
jgi:hypothetical protein